MGGGGSQALSSWLNSVAREKVGTRGGHNIMVHSLFQKRRGVHKELVLIMWCVCHYHRSRWRVHKESVLIMWCAYHYHRSRWTVFHWSCPESLCTSLCRTWVPCLSPCAMTCSGGGRVRQDVQFLSHWWRIECNPTTASCIVSRKHFLKQITYALASRNTLHPSYSLPPRFQKHTSSIL